jgi:hypothetical protein
VRSDQHIRFADAALPSRVWRSDVAVDALLGDVAEIAGAGEHTSRGKRRTTGRWEMMDLGASPCSCRR